MNKTFALAATLAAGIALAPMAADAAFFLGQRADGKVYKIDTTSGAATIFLNYSDTAGTNAFSPNALAYDGSNTYRTTFGASPVQWQRNRTTVSGNLPIDSGASGVAAGDVHSGTYYYVDQKGGYYSLSASAASATSAQRIGKILAETFGDLVIASDGSKYVSYGSVGLATLSGTSLSTLATQGTKRFAGLGFGTDGNLYGVTGGSTTTDTELWRLDPTGFSNAHQIGTVKFNGSNLQLTDAASMIVPVPAALPLLLTALGALGVIGRRKMKAAATGMERINARPRA
jgi:hypothetical protein